MIWLVAGDVFIAGSVNVNGQKGHPTNSELPRFAAGGPGGFECGAVAAAD